MLELVRRHEETDNDVYFLDVIGYRVVINDDYRGLKVLSTNLEPLMNIPVFDGWIIDLMYNNERTGTDGRRFCGTLLLVARLNADFNSWCANIAGTAGYVLAGKSEQIPQDQMCG